MITNILLLTVNMNLTNQLYKKVTHLVTDIKETFRTKGLIIPIQEKDGSIKFEHYIVVKKNGFYSILNASNITMFEHINLPQTAILLANNLALGKLIDDKLLTCDRQYGYCLFESDQYKRVASLAAKKQDWSKFDILMEKQDRVNIKAEVAKHTIMNSFEKLRRIR